MRPFGISGRRSLSADDDASASLSEQNQFIRHVVRTHKRLASVTTDSEFAYVEYGCGHVTIKRDGNRIILVAGPGCQLAVSSDLDTVTAVSSKEAEKH